ncbi:F-box/RNI-like superfamily protein [Klebsormidium nitens]|uniref:F-box/RNI-like superfamily protein n=1 Tax=Klebsormidium nitens TaxID=105231 RepID=A0A1Y1HZX5_KLENI|nr:F-box/RNI-like superfamily protein [Klebsormidium nitens]|eukprot:GAQ82076.1 F-box/RNI-like superfamily protein [Klebsormidium nitens]
MELRSGKCMRRATFVTDEPQFEPSGPSAIEAALPDDVLMRVFQQLERQGDWEALSLVSKRWRRLAAGACTKLHVTRRAGGQRMTQVLRRFGPGLHTLYLSSAPFVRDSDLRTLPLLCPNLTSIYLSWQDSFSDAGLSALAQACGPRLLELGLSRCQGLSFHGIAAACQYLPNLRFLDLSHVLGKAKVLAVQPCALAAFTVKLPSVSSEDGGAGGSGGDDSGGNDSGGKDSGGESSSEGAYYKSGPPFSEFLSHRLMVECEYDSWGNEFRFGYSLLDAEANGAESSKPGGAGGAKKGGGAKEGLGDIDSAVASIAHSCKQLQTLLLKDCSALCELSDHGLDGVASGQCAQTLTTLDLSFCENVTDAGLLNVAKHCPKLTELSLACISVGEKVTSAGLGQVLKQCTGLTELDLSGNMLGPQWFVQLGLHSKTLVKLNLNRCKSEPEQPYLPVWKMCLKGPAKFTLTHLNLMECTGLEDLGLGMLAVSCISLKVLKISGCLEVTDRGLLELGKFRGGQMEELVIRGAGVGNTGRDSFQSGAPWPKLHSLAVSQCEWMEDESLQSIALHCSALTFLEAGDCFDASGLGFSHILDKCTKLEKLMLYQIPNIDTLEPGPPCHRLRELDVSGCSLKAGPLRTLAERCPNLENVDISGNRHLEREGLLAMVVGCKGLAVLDIQDCPKLTDKAINLALEASTSLRKVFVTRIKLSQRLEKLGLRKGCKVRGC